MKKIKKGETKMTKTNENLKERIVVEIINDTYYETYTPFGRMSFEDAIVEEEHKIIIIYANGEDDELDIYDWEDDDERYDIKCEVDTTIENSKKILKEKLQGLECKDMEDLSTLLKKMGLSYKEYKEDNELGYVVYAVENNRKLGKNNTVIGYRILGFVSIKNDKLNVNDNFHFDTEFIEKEIF